MFLISWGGAYNFQKQLKVGEHFSVMAKRGTFLKIQISYN